MIGFETEDDWLDYRMENEPRFLRRIATARENLLPGEVYPGRPCNSRVVQGDCLLKLSLQQALAVAQGLAGVHATWLGHQALDEAAWLPCEARWERGIEDF